MEEIEVRDDFFGGLPELVMGSLYTNNSSKRMNAKLNKYMTILSYRFFLIYVYHCFSTRMQLDSPRNFLIGTFNTLLSYQVLLVPLPSPQLF